MDRLLEFATNHPILISSAVFLTILTLANEFRTVSRRGVDLSPQDAIALINSGATVVDVRGIDHYKNGHIINARHIPMDELADKADNKLGGNKEAPVVIYDENGSQGARAVNVLRAQQFTNVVNIKGGVGAWARENFPLEAGK
ncbi:MAG: rhodanese-like domain-containing protein [Gammaproteobacteria bacterium]